MIVVKGNVEYIGADDVKLGVITFPEWAEYIRDGCTFALTPAEMHEVKLIDFGSVKYIGSRFYNKNHLMIGGMDALERISFCEIFDNLERVNAPELVEINENQFKACKMLESVSIPKAQVIGPCAFALCPKLKNVTFGNIQRIMSSAFDSCRSLKTIELPEDSEVFIQTQAFARTGLEKVDLHSCSLTSSAFFACSDLKEVKIDDLSRVPGNSFSYCNNLSSITLLTAPREYNLPYTGECCEYELRISEDAYILPSEPMKMVCYNGTTGEYVQTIQLYNKKVYVMKDGRYVMSELGEAFELSFEQLKVELGE